MPAADVVPDGVRQREQHTHRRRGRPPARPPRCRASTSAPGDALGPAFLRAARLERRPGRPASGAPRAGPRGCEPGPPGRAGGRGRRRPPAGSAGTGTDSTGWPGEPSAERPARRPRRRPPAPWPRTRSCRPRGRPAACGTRRANAVTTASATCSAQAAVASTRSRPVEVAVRDLPPRAVGQPHQFAGAPASARPPGVSAMPVPVRAEQRVAQVGAQRRHRGRDRRLAHAERRRRRPQRAELGHQCERAELGERHGSTLITGRLWTMLTVTQVTDKRPAHQGPSVGARRSGGPRAGTGSVRLRPRDQRRRRPRTARTPRPRGPASSPAGTACCR